MKCKHCGYEPPNEMKYCPLCGHKIPKPKPEPQPLNLAGAIKQYEPVLTVNEACSLLRCSRSMIYALIAQEKIPCFRLGSHIRFKTETLLSWADGLEQITTAG